MLMSILFHISLSDSNIDFVIIQIPNRYYDTVFLAFHFVPSFVVKWGCSSAVERSLCM